MQALKMPDVNNVLIAGHLISDPTFRKTTTGTPVTNFFIASNRKFRDHTGQWRENVCFVGVVAWYKLAESCYENLQKGSAVLVDGELQSRALRNEDGSTRNIVEIKARRIQFLDRRPSRDTTAESVPSAQPVEQDTGKPAAEEKAKAAEVEESTTTEAGAEPVEAAAKPSESEEPKESGGPSKNEESTPDVQSAEEEEEADTSSFQFGYRDWRS